MGPVRTRGSPEGALLQPAPVGTPHPAPWTHPAAPLQPIPAPWRTHPAPWIRTAHPAPWIWTAHPAPPVRAVWPPPAAPPDPPLDSDVELGFPYFPIMRKPNRL